MGFIRKSKFNPDEPAWGEVKKSLLPREAFFVKGEPGKKSTWGYPWKYVTGGKVGSDGVYESGTLWPHRGGLNAAWEAAHGARSGEKAGTGLLAAIEAKRKEFGLEKAGKAKGKEKNFYGPTCAIALNAEGEKSQAPEWVHLLPSGNFIMGRDGRNWRNSNPAGVVAAHTKKIPLDINHSTELKARIGEESPAAGWIDPIELRPNGEIWGKVDWTPRGREAVENREYCFISPVLQYNETDSEILEIPNAALTNQPNLDLVALNRKEESNMDGLKEIAKALGLPVDEDVTLADILAEIKEWKGKMDEGEKRAKECDDTVMQSKARAEEAEKKEKEATKRAENSLSRDVYDIVMRRALNAESALTKYHEDQLNAEIDALVGAAVKEGKVTPAQEATVRSMCRKQDGMKDVRDFLGVAIGLSNPIPYDPAAIERATNATGDPNNPGTAVIEGGKVIGYLTEGERILAAANHKSPAQYVAEMAEAEKLIGHKPGQRPQSY